MPEGSAERWTLPTVPVRLQRLREAWAEYWSRPLRDQLKERK